MLNHKGTAEEEGIEKKIACGLHMLKMRINNQVDSEWG